jgi:hypothetical protein
MAASDVRSGTLSVVFKKIASVFTVVSFLAAVVFFVGILWLPESAASSSTDVDVQPSLLLALDKPQPPTPKIRVASLADEIRDTNDLASPDLASELNGWTYTQSSLASQIMAYNIAQMQLMARNQLNTLYTDVSMLRNTALLLQTILTDFGQPIPLFLTNAINVLTYVQNGLSAYR